MRSHLLKEKNRRKKSIQPSASIDENTAVRGLPEKSPVVVKETPSRDDRAIQHKSTPQPSTLQIVVELLQYLFHVILQCFIIVPWLYLYDKILRDLKVFASQDHKGESSATYRQYAAQIIINYFDDDKQCKTPKKTRSRSDKPCLPQYSGLRPLVIPSSPTSPPPLLQSNLNRNSEFASRSMQPSNPLKFQWLNDLVLMSWESLAEFFRVRMQDVLDGILLQLADSSSYIKRAKVKGLTLGSIPPEIMDIKVQNKITLDGSGSGPHGSGGDTDTGDQFLHIEVTFRWHSGCEGVLEIVTEALGMDIAGKLSCNEVFVAGTMQCLLGPLIPAFPQCRYAKLYFHEKPTIDLHLNIIGHPLFGGDLEITKTVGKILRSKLRSMLKEPNSITIPVNSTYIPPH